MPSLFTNNALTTITVGITAVSTSVTVNDASAFPLSVGQDYFYITMQDAVAGTHIEIAKVTAVTGNTFTIVRGLEGTSPYAFQPGDKLELRLTAVGFKEIRLPRVVTNATTTSLTVNGDTTDQYNITALASAIAIQTPSGTPASGQKLIIRLLDNGTARSITWPGSFIPIGTTLPTTTIVSKLTYLGFIYNSEVSFWNLIAWIQEV